MGRHWYVLSVADTGPTLLRCDTKGFEHLDLRPDDDGAEDGLEAEADIVTSYNRFEESGAARRASDAAPEATAVDDDLFLAGNGTERYLRSIADGVEECMEDDPAPLFVAMDESRWAMFQAVCGLDQLPARLDARPDDATADELWELSKRRRA